jgi:hypothetical protein
MSGRRPQTTRGTRRILGALRVRRYGWETTGVVRIDGFVEVFLRLDPDAVAGPLFQPVSDGEGW